MKSFIIEILGLDSRFLSLSASLNLIFSFRVCICPELVVIWGNFFDVRVSLHLIDRKVRLWREEEISLAEFLHILQTS